MTTQIKPSALPAESEKPRIIYPPGFVTDPDERRRLVRELRGSIPDLMTQDQLQKLRELS
jgi:hypothetical protein